MLERTTDVMTAGITNIPLTKPAFVYFIADMNDNNRIEQIYNVFNSGHIQFRREDNERTQKAYFTSEFEIGHEWLKRIWRNFKSLRPKVKSSWKYFFWEIDTQSPEVLRHVTGIYEVLKLPVYIHETTRGYHFLSVKPIEESLWTYAVNSVRKTNPDYPPVTLRIQPNKYIGENNIFANGYIVDTSDNISGKGKKHYDTVKLREWIEGFNLTELQQNYVIVFYPFPNQNQLDLLSLEQRAKFQLKQIEDSQ